jgi:hypothetical protein
MAPAIFNFRTSWKMAVSFIILPLSPYVKVLGASYRRMHGPQGRSGRFVTVS